MGVVGSLPRGIPRSYSRREPSHRRWPRQCSLLKPDPQTPVSGGVLYARLFEAAGLPEGLFHVLPGGAETGDALVRDPLVNMISFTGSTRVGQEIGAVAAAYLSERALSSVARIPTSCLTTSTSKAAASAGRGIVFASGQVCMSAGRHLGS